jgi:hypothetical protein
MYGFDRIYRIDWIFKTTDGQVCTRVRRTAKDANHANIPVPRAKILFKKHFVYLVYFAVKIFVINLVIHKSILSCRFWDSTGTIRTFENFAKLLGTVALLGLP